MAAKRNLYKPAQLESVGSKERRSPLVQGRLVSKPLIPDTMTVYASPVDLRNSCSNTAGDTSITISHSGLPTTEYSASPRQNLANISSTYGQHSPEHTTIPPRSYEFDSVFEQAPRSPPKPTPTDLLDLSDGDDRCSSCNLKSPVQHIKHSPSSSPVLMVDAGGRRMDLDASEVEIMTNLVTSPAKVICHAPAVVESDLRNTGYIQETAKVPVDSVPSISVLGDLDLTADHPSKLDPPLHRIKPPQVVKETTQAAHTRTVKAEIERDLSIEQSLTSDESLGRETSASSVDSSRLGHRTQKKKKSKGRVVASRYMQKTDAVKQKADTTQNSIMEVSTRKELSRPESTSKSVMGRPSSKVVTRKTSRSSSRVISSKPPLSYTLLEGGKGVASGGVTSTPTVGPSRLPSSSGLDASAIQPVHGMSTLMGEDVSMIARLSQSDSPTAHRPDVDVTRTHHAIHKKHTKDREVSQFYLDRLYARYLQWVYIDTKLRKSFQEQEKDAMGQFFAMWCENEKLRKRKAELELALATIKHENHLDEQLEIQRSGLGPITINTDLYGQQYSTMAHALDTTRHQLPLRGIHIPDDEESYQDALIAALDESDNLMQQFTLTVGSDQGSKVTSFAKAMQTLENVVENEGKELKRCQELLAATSSLTTHVSSLQIQQMEEIA